MKAPNLAELEKQYEQMLKIAELSDYDLTPAFEQELLQLTRVLKSMGSKIVK